MSNHSNNRNSYNQNGQRKELFRDSQNGKIAGVCAGIANYFGWETWLVRVLVISGLLFGFGFIFVLYVAGWLVLNKKPLTQPNDGRFHADQNANSQNSEKTSSQYSADNNGSIKVKTRIWQAGEPPKQALHDIHSKFKGLEQKLIRMECYVTSSEFTLNREINRL